MLIDGAAINHCQQFHCCMCVCHVIKIILTYLLIRITIRIEEFERNFLLLAIEISVRILQDQLMWGMFASAFGYIDDKSTQTTPTSANPAVTLA